MITITPEQMQQAIAARLPAYFSTSEPAFASDFGEKYPGTWFSMAFNYPGSKVKYCWISLPDDMTEERIDIWATDAAVQIKLTQQIDELNDRAKVMEQNLALKR
jgi:hypothetical protein